MFNRSRFYDVEEIKITAEIYKHFLDFFKPDTFLMITEWEGKDFLNHIKNVFANTIKYLEASKQKDGRCYISISVIPRIIKFYQQFPEIFELSLEGKRSAAYAKLCDLMNGSYMPIATFNQLTHHYSQRSDTDYVYRMRAEKEHYNTVLEKKDLFHIPFEKRHLIKNNRFSLTGFPCLYFGSSIYGCWEEMGRPALGNCFTSKFDLSGHHFIDLSVLPERVNKQLARFHDILIKEKHSMREDSVRLFEYLLSDYLFLWPLIFCSSIRTHYTDSVYKPEYIFPQLLLEWLVSEVNYYDGIIFHSTKRPLLAEKFGERTYSLMKNYVIPVRILKPKGLCEESLNKIRVTDPINLEIETLTGNIPKNDPDTGVYNNSVFGHLETILSTKPFETITND